MTLGINDVQESAQICQTQDEAADALVLISLKFLPTAPRKYIPSSPQVGLSGSEHLTWHLARDMHKEPEAFLRLVAFSLPQPTPKTRAVPKMVRRRLLCVDDDSAFRQFYKTLLGSYGYDVTVAANGRQALKLFLSRKVDAVLTDFEMPGMTGAELAARLKRLRPELPVLLISGSKSVQQSPPPAVDATVGKGASSTKLIDQIEILLAHSRRAKLNARRLAPLGSVLASIALAVYALPRILK